MLAETGTFRLKTHLGLKNVSPLKLSSLRKIYSVGRQVWMQIFPPLTKQGQVLLRTVQVSNKSVLKSIV